MQVKRRLAAIMAADVVGYSRLMGADEEGTLRRMKALMAEEVRPRMAEHKGRVVKTMGDGFLASFGSVYEAFQCALKLQKAAEARNEGVPADRQIVMRIGINVGDIIIDDGDVFGDGVNIAARLESLARPGGICVSSRAWEDLRKLDLKFTDMGEMKLKNIAMPVRAYSFQHSDPYVAAAIRPTPPEMREEPVAAAAAATAEPTPAAPSRRLRPTLMATAAALLLIAGLGVSALILTRPKPAAPADVVNAELAATPCSWLRISDRSSVDGVFVYKISGSSATPPGQIARAVTAAAKRQGVEIDRVLTTDVAPLYPSQCGWIDQLDGFRYTGVPRFRLQVTRVAKGVSRAALTFDPAGLGPAGAIYGIEPSGTVQRIVTREELEALRLPGNPDGTQTLEVDIDHVGWNGIVFMEAKAPAQEGVVERAAASDEDRAAFGAQARAGAWRFELAWFKVEP